MECRRERKVRISMVYPHRESIATCSPKNRSIFSHHYLSLVELPAATGFPSRWLAELQVANSNAPFNSVANNVRNAAKQTVFV